MELLKTTYEMRVSDGFVERNDDGKIIAQVEFAGVTVHNHSAMKIMGVDKAAFATADQFLSRNPNSPTIFESLTDFTVSRGTSLPQLMGEKVEMPGDVLGKMFIKIGMHYDSGILAGEYIAFSDQSVFIPGQIPYTFKLDLAGNYELRTDTRR